MAKKHEECPCLYPRSPWVPGPPLKKARKPARTRGHLEVDEAVGERPQSQPWSVSGTFAWLLRPARQNVWNRDYSRKLGIFTSLYL